MKVGIRPDSKCKIEIGVLIANSIFNPIVLHAFAILLSRHTVYVFFDMKHPFDPKTMILERGPLKCSFQTRNKNPRTKSICILLSNRDNI